LSEEPTIGEAAPAAPEKRGRGRPKISRPTPQAIEPAAKAIAAAIVAPVTARDADDPRARAAKRAAELREHLGNLDQGTDKYYVDPRVIPDGWTYEWKTLTVLGKENPSYQVHLARAGWEPVPVYRHPEMMPDSYQGATIERDGQILMERPAEITQEAVVRDKRAARSQVTQKEEQLSGNAAGDKLGSGFSGTNSGNRIGDGIKKSYTHINPTPGIPIPE
jgi:hypothetical protein